MSRIYESNRILYQTINRNEPEINLQSLSKFAEAMATFQSHVHTEGLWLWPTCRHGEEAPLWQLRSVHQSQSGYMYHQQHATSLASPSDTGITVLFSSYSGAPSKKSTTVRSMHPRTACSDALASIQVDRE